MDITERLVPLKYDKIDCRKGNFDVISNRLIVANAIDDIHKQISKEQ